MPVDRPFWKQHMTKTWAPAYPCPTCRKGSLGLRKNSVQEGETAESKLASRREHWDPTEDEARFVAFLDCGNKSCGEVVVVTGRRFTEPEYDYSDQAMGWELQYHPRYFDPPMQYIVAPTQCPRDILDELRNSFRLLLIDPSGAANRLRVAVERLLDAQGIKARARQPGRIVKLSLHERIELFRKAKPDLGEGLMAVKWLGNAGSHESSLSRDDVFDGYDIVEHVLVEVLTERAARIHALAKQINRRKGPRSRRR